MFVSPNLRLYTMIGAGLAFALLLAWALRVDHLRGDWKERHENLTAETVVVTTAAQLAADNPELEWAAVPDQVLALGNSNRQLKDTIAEQNRSIAVIEAEAARLRARADELRREAELAQRERRSAQEQLTAAALTPGTRDDCDTLLHEAEAALDTAYEAGL